MRNKPTVVLLARLQDLAREQNEITKELTRRKLDRGLLARHLMPEPKPTPIEGFTDTLSIKTEPVDNGVKVTARVEVPESC